MGIRIIDNQVDAGQLLSLTLDIQKQMASGFSDIDFFLERYLPQARHIEFQILGDGKKVVHLGERDCTIQRRFQKLLEEAPSPYITEKEREEMGKLAVKICQSMKYEGAATVEFIMDTTSREFYFMEINPRIQVEHPITEAITGIDIVEQQIKVAQGERLSFSQEDVHFNGWAIEARINAEDPHKNFQPNPGKISKYFPSGGQGVFLHSFLHQGQEIYPFFDSLLAKVIAHGKDRKDAVKKMKRALDELIIEGVETTTPFFKMVLKNKEFLKGEFNTNFIERSGILKELMLEPYLKKKIQESLIEGLTEEELAGIIFNIYKNIKKKAGQIKKPVSKWVNYERFNMMQ